MEIFTLCLLLLLSGGVASASPVPCDQSVSRDNLAHCVLASSLVLAVEAGELDAARARVVAATPLLPSNPVVSLSVQRRDGTTTNWYATLTQEVEVAGQRGLRRSVAERNVTAESYRATDLRLDVLAFAWTAYFDALAARAATVLTGELYAVTESVARVARAKAEQGLIASVDADLAEATSLRVLQELRASERAGMSAAAQLAALLGRDAVAVTGDLVPLEAADAIAAGIEHRPDVRALATESESFELQARVLERARVPNPTLSLFAQNDGFDESVVGIGVAIPIPVPGNIGRTSVGEITEARARAAKADAERERLMRDVRYQRLLHANTYASLRDEVEAFDPARLERARVTLVSIADEVRSGRLAVRDAVLAQQTLVEMLRGHVATRRALCVESVAVLHASGAGLDGVVP